LLEHGPKELVGAFGKAPFDKYPEDEEKLLPEGWSPEFVEEDVDFDTLMRAYADKKVITPQGDIYGFSYEDCILGLYPLFHIPQFNSFITKIAKEFLAGNFEVIYLYTAVAECGFTYEEELNQAEIRPFGWEIASSEESMENFFQETNFDLLTMKSAPSIILDKWPHRLLYIPNFDYLCSESLFKN